LAAAIEPVTGPAASAEQIRAAAERDGG